MSSIYSLCHARRKYFNAAYAANMCLLLLTVQLCRRGIRVTQPPIGSRAHSGIWENGHPIVHRVEFGFLALPSGAAVGRVFDR